MRPLTFLPTDIPGAVEVLAQRSEDLRGSFTKILHEERFTASLLPGHFAEWYHTYSHPGVLRGLHFQGPEKAQGKLVFCLSGRVLDVGVDLRVGSPTYRSHVAVELTGEAANGIYLPPGLAHGYLVLGDEPAVMLYGATEVYHPPADGGIAWDSAGVAWPTDAPILSDRDRELPALADFDSPFRYEGA